MAKEGAAIVYEILRGLSLTQLDLGELIGVSRRTAQRLAAGDSWLSQDNFIVLARAAHPRNPELAARIAAMGGMTLAAAGIATPQPVPIAPSSTAISALALDSLLCTAADAMGSTPRAARQVLLPTFSRAKELGLSVEKVLEALEHEGLGRDRRSNS